MLMISKSAKPFPYARKQRAFGDEFEVRGSDINLLKALGWAIPADEPKPAPKMQTRALVADPPAPAPAPVAPVESAAPREQAPTAAASEPPWVGVDVAGPEPEPKPKRTYLRRDLKAEDT